MFENLIRYGFMCIYIVYLTLCVNWKNHFYIILYLISNIYAHPRKKFSREVSDDLSFVRAPITVKNNPRDTT